jgi:glycosyltransferase involved in cell wall biosynthesis
VVDGETGFVVRAFDREGMAKAIDLLLADEGLRRAMGGAGRTFALGRFDARVMVDALEKVYAEALGVSR